MSVINSHLKVKIPSMVFKVHHADRFSLFWGTFLLCVSEGLPYMKSLPSIVRHSIFLFSSLLIIAGTAMVKRFSKELLFTFALALIINFALYLRIYSYIEITDYMVQTIRCWLFILCGIYYSEYGNIYEKTSIRRLIILIGVVTAITSIIVLQDYPSVVRSLGNGAVDRGYDVQYFYSRNTASWGVLYGIVFLIPTLINWFKKTKKIIILIVIAIMMLLLLRAQITFALLTGITFLLLLVIPPQNMQRTLFGIVTVVILLLLLSPFYADIVWYFYNKIPDTVGYFTLRKKIYELYLTLKLSSAYGDASARFSLYSTSIKTFLDHPLIGYNASHDVSEYTNIGHHSQILDNLAGIGILGFLPFVAIFLRSAIRIFKSFKNSKDRSYLFLMFIMLIILMILNPVFVSPTLFMSTFLFPTLFNEMEET